jgi:hypothetical protein
MDASPYVYQPNTNQDLDHATEIICSSSSILLKDGCKSICLSTQYQPRPRPCYRNYMFFHKHTPKGWMQVHMFINPTSVSVGPVPTIFDSSTKYESTKYPTQPRAVAVQPRPRTCKGLYVLPHKNS